MSEIIITQTVSPKCYCKYGHIMCEFANDRGYCVKTGCSRRIVVNDMPKVNHNLVEVVRCKDCKQREQYECNHIMLGKTKCGVSDNWFCADGEKKHDT